MHPFEFLKSKNPDGIDNFIADIKQRITEVDAFVVKSAEEAGQPELADKDTLYNLFKRGVQENLVYGLHDVFVHYYYIFKRQMLNEMLCVHQFDERDIEILKYFHDEYVYPKYNANRIRIQCPSMLVFESTFIITTPKRFFKYVSLFYKLIGYAYDALITVYGGAKGMNNPSLNVDSIFEFDIPEGTFIRNSNVKPIVCYENFWIRNNSELKIQRNKKALETHDYKTTQHKYGKSYYMKKKNSGLVLVNMFGSYRWVDKKDVIIIGTSKVGDPYRYVLRDECTPEQIAYYDSHKEEIESKFEQKFKNTGKKRAD